MSQPLPSGPVPTANPPRRGGCAPWAVGCGVTLLVALLVGGGALYWFVGRPLIGVYQAIQEVGRIETLDARVTNRAPFAAPTDGELSEAQVERFLAVHGRIQTGLAARVDALQRRVDELDGRSFVWTDAFQLAEAYRELFELLVEAKEAQVAALNAEGFSVAEYAWVRRESLRALGLAGAAPDLGAFVGTFTGDGPTAGPPVAAAVPEANRALLERYRDGFEETAFLALIGF